MTMRSYRSHDSKDQALKEGRADACSLGDGGAASTTKVHGPMVAAPWGTSHSIWWEPGMQNLQGSALHHAAIPESSLHQNWITNCEIWERGRDINAYFGFFFISYMNPHFESWVFF